MYPQITQLKPLFFYNLGLVACLGADEDLEHIPLFDKEKLKALDDKILKEVGKALYLHGFIGQQQFQVSGESAIKLYHECSNISQLSEKRREQILAKETTTLQQKTLEKIISEPRLQTSEQDINETEDFVKETANLVYDEHAQETLTSLIKTFPHGSSNIASAIEKRVKHILQAIELKAPNSSDTQKIDAALQTAIMHLNSKDTCDRNTAGQFLEAEKMAIKLLKKTF